MIRFNIDYPGFTAGRNYEAKYAMHPFYGNVAIKVVDDDGDTRYICPLFLQDCSIVEVDEEGDE